MGDSEINRLPPSKNRVTRDDVARRARVSTAVVSYVINNGPRPVAPETRERVERAIAELGYFPNTIARSLRAEQTNTIGLIIPSLNDPAYAEIASEFLAICNEAGYLVVICNSARDAQHEEKAIRMLRNHQVDGVALLPAQDSPALLRPLLFAGIPTVVLDRYLPNAHSITIDELESGRLGTQHLLALGHRRIGLLLQNIERTNGSERLLGYCQALASSQIAYDDRLVVNNVTDLESAYQAMWRLLSIPPRPTAIFADNDLIALGALRAIYSAGLRVPEDISIVGYGSSRLAEGFAPPLTTVCPAPYSLARFAADTLMQVIKLRNHASASTAILPVELVVRASTAPPRLS